MLNIRESQVGPYERPPSAEDPRIRNALDKGLPEEIVGLTWQPPDFSADGHKIIHAFAIDRKKRPGRDLIPCAICSGERPKFLDGAILWSPDRYLRVIGHVCAARPEHFGEARYRVLREKSKQEQLDRAALDWLQAQICGLQKLRSDVETLRRVALFIEKESRSFFNGVRPLAEFLANVVKREGGRLTFSQEISGTRRSVYEISGSRSDRYEDLTAGFVRGGQFVMRPNKVRSEELLSLQSAMERLPSGDSDTALSLLIDRGGEHEVTTIAGLALRAVQRAAQFGEQCADAFAFIADENLTTLKSWGADARAPLRFTMLRSAHDVTFKLDHDFSRARLSLYWPRVPDLTPFYKIADAGLRLDALLPKTSPPLAGLSE